MALGLRNTQWAIVLFSCLVCLVGIIIFIPAWNAFWDDPTRLDEVMSVNLCLSSKQKSDENSFRFFFPSLFFVVLQTNISLIIFSFSEKKRYVGRQGECPSILDDSNATDDVEPTSQEFPVGGNYFDGGDFPISFSVYGTKGVRGFFSIEIRQNTIVVYEEQDIPIIDPGTFGVVGSGNITIFRTSPWNLSGMTNTTSLCEAIEGCLYYPLFSTYFISDVNEFELEKVGNTTIKVFNVELEFKTGLETPVTPDFLIEFQNEPPDDTLMIIGFLILGALMIDATPGIGFFLWFQEDAYFGENEEEEEGGESS